MGGVSHTLIVGNTSLCTYIDVYISGQAYSMKVNSEVAIHCCNPLSIFFRYPTLKMSVCGESESVLCPTSGQHFGLYANFKYFDRMVLGLVCHVEP